MVLRNVFLRLNNGPSGVKSWRIGLIEGYFGTNHIAAVRLREVRFIVEIIALMLRIL
jgi:hypothetical protein